MVRKFYFDVGAAQESGRRLSPILKWNALLTHTVITVCQI